MHLWADKVRENEREDKKTDEWEQSVRKSGKGDDEGKWDKEERGGVKRDEAIKRV